MLVGESWKYFADWLREQKPQTVGAYLHWFIEFLRLSGENTETLYSKVNDSLKSDDRRAKLWLGQKLTEFQIHMRDVLGHADEETGKATGTVTAPVKGAVAFFRCNAIEDLTLNGGVEISSNEYPTIEADQIKQILDSTGNFRNRALLYFLKDSGLRVSDARRVTIGDLREAMEDTSIKFATFEIRQEKTKLMANPTIGYETLDALRVWMRYRREVGLPCDDSDPLFTTVKAVSGFTERGEGREGFTHKSTKRGEFMARSSISATVSNLIAKAGLKNQVVAHSFRKFTQTSLEYGGVPATWINKITGRKGVGTVGIYSKPNPEQLIEFYSRAYSKLLVSSAPETMKAELKSQRTEMESLRTELEELKKANSRLERSYEIYRKRHDEDSPDTDEGEDIMRISKKAFNKMIEDAITRRLSQ